MLLRRVKEVCVGQHERLTVEERVGCLARFRRMANILAYFLKFTWVASAIRKQKIMLEIYIFTAQQSIIHDPSESQHQSLIKAYRYSPHQLYINIQASIMRDRNRDESPQYRRRSRDRHEERSRQRRVQRGPQNEWPREERKPFMPKPQPQEKAIIQAPKVNRKESCPFLVRIFYAINNENTFADPEKLPQSQLKLHLWLNSSLREVAELMRCYLPSIRTKQSFIFWRVHPEQGKGMVKQQLGCVLMHRKNDRTEERFLGNGQFSIGDYLDVSINYK